MGYRDATENMGPVPLRVSRLDFHGEDFAQGAYPLPDQRLRQGHRHGLHAALQPAVTVAQPFYGALVVAPSEWLAIGLCSDSEVVISQGSTHGSIEMTAAELHRVTLDRIGSGTGCVQIRVAPAC